MAVKVGSVYVDFFAKTGKFTKGIGDATKKLDKFGLSVRKVARRATILTGIIGGAGAGLVKSFISASSEAEQYRIRLNALLGSADKAAKVFEDQTKFASKVSFQYKEIMASATSLAGVLKGGRDEINRYMPIIADLAAVTGMGIQEVTGQVIRMYSAGAAAADMFRERGILSMMGFRAGVKYTAEETRAMLIGAWEDSASKFRGAADELGKSWQGLTSMMSDRWFQFRELVGRSGMFDAAKNAMQSFLDVLDTATKTGAMAKFAENISDMVIKTVRGIGEVVGVIGNLIAEFEKDPKMLKEGLLGYLLLGPKGAALLPWLGREFEEFFRVVFFRGVSGVERLEKANIKLINQLNAWREAGLLTAEAEAKIHAQILQNVNTIQWLQGVQDDATESTFKFSDALLKFAEALKKFGEIAVTTGEKIKENIIRPMLEVQQTFDEWIPPDVDLGIYAAKNFGDAVRSMSYTLTSSLERSGLAFSGFADDVIRAFRRIVINNYVKKFTELMARVATTAAGGPLAGIASILGFQQGGPVTGGMAPGSRDIIPALLSPGERVIPAGQPASAAQPVGANIIVHVTASSVFGTKGERKALAHEIKEALEDL